MNTVLNADPQKVRATILCCAHDLVDKSKGSLVLHEDGDGHDHLFLGDKPIGPPILAFDLPFECALENFVSEVYTDLLSENSSVAEALASAFMSN